MNFYSLEGPLSGIEVGVAGVLIDIQEARRAVGAYAISGDGPFCSKLLQVPSCMLRSEKASIQEMKQTGD